MIVHEYAGSDLVAPATVQLKEEVAGFSARATGAEFTTCTVFVEDENGALDFESFSTWRIRETTATAGNRVFWAGFVAEARISRGEDPTYPVGAGRRWELDLEECNVFVQRRLLLPGDGSKRPAETVDERIAWLLTTVGFTGGLIVDHGLIQSSSVAMDENDYSVQTGKDVLDSLAVATGYTPHIRYREATDDYELIFLDFLRSGQDLSSFQISNDKADIATPPANPWVPSDQATLHRSPERRASGIGVAYPNGFSYQQDAGTQAAIGDVDRLTPAGDVKTKAAADALGLRLLDQEAEDEERVDNLTVRVPAANVNDVKQGQLLQAKFVHFPTRIHDWTEFVYCRVTQRTVKRPENLTQGFYDLDLELIPTTLPVTANTFARTFSPEDSEPYADYLGSGLVRVGWHSDGDDPPVGSPPEPLTGPVAYIGSAGSRSGLEITGTGILSLVRFAASVSLVVSGSHTFTATIRQNGIVIATGTQVSSGGLRSQIWTFGGTAGLGTEVRATNVAVVPGDVFEGYIHTSALTPVDVIPVGVGETGFRLQVEGSLAA